MVFEDILKKLKKNYPWHISLDLSSHELDDENVEALCEALKDNNSLAMLNVSSNKISMQGYHHLCRIITNTQSLTNMNISDNCFNFSDRVMKQKFPNALFLNHSLVELEGVSDKTSFVLLERNKAIADAKSIFEAYSVTSPEEIKKVLHKLDNLASVEWLPQTVYFCKVHRLLKAVYSLSLIEHPASTMRYLVQPFIEPQGSILRQLNQPFQDDALQQVADKITIELLMAAPNNSETLATRHKLLAYLNRENPDYLEFNIGLRGFAIDDLSGITFGSLYEEKDDVAYISYDDIYRIAKEVYASAEAEGLEKYLLAKALQKKEYCAITVDALFHSPLFVDALKQAYPVAKQAQCLEGYLELQYVKGFGDAYELSIEPIITQDVLDNYKHLLAEKQTIYPNLHTEIQALKASFCELGFRSEKSIQDDYGFFKNVPVNSDPYCDTSYACK